MLLQLAPGIRASVIFPGRIGVNDGLHLTGGEPFMNYDRLVRVTRLAREIGIPSLFVETNAAWCVDDRTTREKLVGLREAGLDGILISANPFTLEEVPFERTERAARVALEVFPAHNVIVYQSVFFEQFRRMGLKGTMPLDEYLATAGETLYYMELFASGRVPYALGLLFRRSPASRFFGQSCRAELLRDWHVHVDNEGNLMPGFCGGISLGDARRLDQLLEQGVDLTTRPVLRALLTDLRELYDLGLAHGYQPLDGYVSKCHLCMDVRRHLALTGMFEELAPRELYTHLGELPRPQANGRDDGAHVAS
ncbi:MAG: radical SAM protein [Anaerolineae bacterium]